MKLTAVAIGVVVDVGGCQRAPDIKFMAYEAGYASKPDFARVEYELPLAPADLGRLEPDMLKDYTQEQVDQIYARLTAGPIPDGAYDGDLFFPKGVSGQRRIREIVGGLPGLAAGAKTVKLELLGKHLWRGKVFYRDERVLRNRIDDTSLLKPIMETDTFGPAQVRGRRPRPVAPVSGAPVLRAEPARLASRVGDHRLRVIPTKSRATSRSRTSSPDAADSTCVTRSGWSARGSTWAARISTRCSCSISRSTTRTSPSATVLRSWTRGPWRRTAGPARRCVDGRSLRRPERADRRTIRATGGSARRAAKRKDAPGVRDCGSSLVTSHVEPRRRAFRSGGSGVDRRSR